MNHLKRFGIGMLLGAASVILGYLLGDLTYSIIDFGILNVLLTISGAIAIIGFAYLLGWAAEK